MRQTCVICRSETGLEEWSSPADQDAYMALLGVIRILEDEEVSPGFVQVPWGTSDEQEAAKEAAKEASAAEGTTQATHTDAHTTPASEPRGST
jgi:hypothetical protein